MSVFAKCINFKSESIKSGALAVYRTQSVIQNVHNLHAKYHIDVEMRRTEQSIKPHQSCFHVINECAQARTDVAHSINDGTRFDYFIGVILSAVSIKILHGYALNHWA